MPGTPVHLEFPSEDAERARGGWSGLFGREFGDSAMPDFDYRMTQFDNGTAAAVYPPTDGSKGPIVYLVREDIDGDAGRVGEVGGHAEAKSPIEGMGWFARCRDTEGTAFSLFQGDSSAAA